MLQPINVIPNTHQFKLNDFTKHLIVGTKNQLVIYRFDGELTSKSEKLKTDKINIYSLGASPSMSWGRFGLKGHTVCYCHIENKFIVHPFSICAYDIENDSFCFNVSGDRTFTKIDKTLANVLWKSAYRPNMLHLDNETCFLRSEQTNLTCLNNQTGEELWTYTLPEGEYDHNDWAFVDKVIKTQILKVLGVYKNNVWILLSNNALMALNKETGEQSAYVKAPDNYVNEQSDKLRKNFERDASIRRGPFPFTGDIRLDIETGTIFSFCDYAYIELDLNNASFPLTVWDISQTLAEHERSKEPPLVGLQIGSWENNNIYFHESGLNRYRFGLFDRASKTIQWCEYFDGQEQGYGDILDLKYCNGYLYIQSTNSSERALHIYKV